MKQPVKYREFEKENGNLPSLKDNISNSPIEEKQKILSYLKNKNYIKAVSPGTNFDIFTNDRIMGDYLLYSDGEYVWDFRIVYYFEKYNLNIGPGFIKHILSKVH